ncbi:MAG: hypothetical protein O2843_05640 [Chloroflexi bacterium]|nr:hypothetical protein [Chloroflexota bacterium]
MKMLIELRTAERRASEEGSSEANLRADGYRSIFSFREFGRRELAN